MSSSRRSPSPQTAHTLADRDHCPHYRQLIHTDTQHACLDCGAWLRLTDSGTWVIVNQDTESHPD
ncbi:MAG: hypothetical protein M1499_05300 [Firmicutes bacterium]|uniref:Uncharacterized protein n=1 Tax=Sulfobacillus benefaciens TaxID=453960 RepID=A0A2T2WTG3_9FIRM|nr:hypothetical protein [Bacillota bacterium]PSR25536.1 MAG: hypothetical protein C7B43_16645 [Sulfobacillus benefaciens]